MRLWEAGMALALVKPRVSATLFDVPLQPIWCPLFAFPPSWPSFFSSIPTRRPPPPFSSSCTAWAPRGGGGLQLEAVLENLHQLQVLHLNPSDPARRTSRGRSLTGMGKGLGIPVQNHTHTHTISWHPLCAFTSHILLKVAQMRGTKKLQRSNVLWHIQRIISTTPFKTHIRIFISELAFEFQGH